MNLLEKSAAEIIVLLRANEITPVDLLDQLEKRIAEIDPIVNALPTLCIERARAAAKKLSRLPIDQRGVLAGIPVAIKDTSRVQGVRTTYGSKIFSDYVPEHSDIQVETLEKNGAIVYAKSNTPEFEAGANTFNDVFGATLNPWDISKSAAGSSGGAAVAVATGMAWLAQGSDFACSLRAPASFCSVVGLRPSPGLIAQSANNNVYQNLSVIGPVARTVEDVALFLDAMVGHDPRDPISFSKPVDSYYNNVSKRLDSIRVAFSKDLGITPIDPEVVQLCEQAVTKINNENIKVVERHPDFSGVHDVFRTLRAHHYAIDKKELLEQHRDKMKPEVIWNIEEGLSLTAEDIAKAEKTRGIIIKNVATFFENNDFLITPTMIVPPFPIEERYVKNCNGHEFDNYLEWMSIAYAVTVASCPAISIPCGFTKKGLPIGIQIIGRLRKEMELLQFAYMVEKFLNVEKKPPIDPVKI